VSRLLAFPCGEANRPRNLHRHDFCYFGPNLRPPVSSLPPVTTPRPLMRSVLGKDHPLIREAEKNAARPPPETEDEAANA